MKHKPIQKSVTQESLDLKRSLDESNIDRLVMRNGSSITFMPSNSNKFIGSGIVFCPNCGEQLENDLAVLLCPCLDEYRLNITTH